MQTSVGQTHDTTILPKRARTLWIIVACIAILFSVLNLTHFILGVMNKPPGTVYLGVIHYYEDYLLYLNQFFQGAHGAWLTANQYTAEPTAATFIYWINIGLGKIGAIAGLTPITAYAVSVLLLSVAAFLTSFLVARLAFPGNGLLQFAAFLISTTATSFMNPLIINGKRLWYPFMLWRTPHFAFDRLGGAPHQIGQTVFFLILTVCLFYKPKSVKTTRLLQVGCVLSGAALTTLNPIQGIMFLLVAWATAGLLFVSSGRTRTVPVDPKRIFLTTASVLGAFLYMSSVLDSLPHSQSRLWESQQATHTDLPFFLMSLGPIAFLSLIGIIPAIRDRKPILWFAALMSIASAGIFLSPIPTRIGIFDVRFLFPSTHVLLGLLSANGLWFISKSAQRFIPPGMTMKLMSIAFILLSIPTLYWEISQKSTANAGVPYPLLYLSQDIANGLKKLSATGNFSDVVIANPGTHMDQLVPAIAGHTSYSGHMLATINADSKRANALAFFSRSLTQDEAQKLLAINAISYVFFTKLDGDGEAFAHSYPFLTKIAESESFRIFAVR